MPYHRGGKIDMRRATPRREEIAGQDEDGIAMISKRSMLVKVSADHLRIDRRRE